MSENPPPIKVLRQRHVGWDKPTEENLKTIKTIELLWRNLFEAIFDPIEDNWLEHWQKLYTTILEVCSDNEERRITLVYLSNVKDLTKEAREWKMLVTYLENTKDWARKSIIRGS
ncbi:MAG: hypothetical protein F6K56_01395 [Moorea sp. SIO3G5]|nr:hypothetical protein [Moorena sp. SIO3G5]